MKSPMTAKFVPSDSYLNLVREFPLRPIRNEAEYKAATAVMEKLAVRGEDGLDGGERDYLDALDEFISAYDRKALTDRPRRGTPRQRLRSLMEDSGTNRRDLERILGCGHSLVSLVLSGKRELSKENVRALARHFRMTADYFL
ncbi:MAG TPA: helix-turn-helix domain-containing protein [Tepidisphaeraceae bacterium]|nr:helix-turn-helix domain-containing protein [Tepidisphaeraceae bacterium]